MNIFPLKFALLLAVVASASAAEPKIYQLGELDHAPKASFQAKPRYPTDVIQDQTGAVVDVAFVIDSAGRVVGARVRHCKVDTLHDSVDFDAAARGTDSKTHQAAAAQSDYAALLETANQFAASATKAVSQWRFAPGLKDGRPVDSVMAVKIEYVHKFAFHGDTNQDPIARVGMQTSNDNGAHQESYSSGNGYVLAAGVPAQLLVFYPRL